MKEPGTAFIFAASQVEADSFLESRGCDRAFGCWWDAKSGRRLVFLDRAARLKPLSRPSVYSITGCERHPEYAAIRRVMQDRKAREVIYP